LGEFGSKIGILGTRSFSVGNLQLSAENCKLLLFPSQIFIIHKATVCICVVLCLYSYIAIVICLITVYSHCYADCNMVR